MITMPSLVLRKNMIVKRLAKCGAVSKDKAKTLEEAGILYPRAFPKITEELEKQKIIFKTKNDKYYIKK